MTSKIWLMLASSVLAIIMSLAFYGWRQSGLDLLPIGLPLC